MDPLDIGAGGTEGPCTTEGTVLKVEVLAVSAGPRSGPRCCCDTGTPACDRGLNLTSFMWV